MDSTNSKNKMKKTQKIIFKLLEIYKNNIAKVLTFIDGCQVILKSPILYKNFC